MSSARIDHLVVLTPSLPAGVAWSEATLGVTPGPGGEHAFMGTHNRLLRIATVDHPRAYLELIAINSIAARAEPVRSKRWFDMENPAVMGVVEQQGPRLAHFVACVPDVHAACRALAELGIDRGEPVVASRMTPRGLLEWQITIRPDGQRLFDGCLPTLIQWGETHPASSMPESGVTLHTLSVTHPQAAQLAAAYAAIGLESVKVTEGPANLCATLLTPRGPANLESKGL